MPNFFQRVMPFIAFGIILVLLVAGLVLLSYLLVFGALIGLVLFGIAWLREKLFPSKNITTDLKRGRTIDHDEMK